MKLTCLSNFERVHSGIGMDNHTPFEILKQSGVVGAEKFLQFPVLILDDVIDDLRVCTGPVKFEHFAKMNPDRIQKSLSYQKTRRDIEDKFSLPFNAQNLLTYYRTESSVT